MRATQFSALSISSIALLAAWLGAALLVAMVVAPAAFAVLPSRTLAGALVGRVLPVLFWSGILLGVVVAFVSNRIKAGRIALFASALVAIVSAVAQLVVSPRIESVRSSISGPVDALAIGDPRRVEFGRLHGVSVLLLGIAMLGAFVALVMLARHLSSRTVA